MVTQNNSTKNAVFRSIINFFRRYWLYIIVGLALGTILGYINALISAIVI